MADMDFSAFERFARIFKKGEIIFAEFEPGDTFYLIESGRVELQKVVGGIEKTVDILLPAEMFGEMAILENAPRSATAVALDEVKALEFNAKNFEVLMTGNPQLAMRLLRLFIRRIARSKRHLMTLTLSDPQARIADVFLMLDEELTPSERTRDRREFQVSTEDIAHWAGMTFAETQSTLGHFVSQRRAEVYNDRIIIKNINDFSRLVNSYRRR
jgi:CRP-like cAMP-binding protein